MAQPSTEAVAAAAPEEPKAAAALARDVRAERLGAVTGAGLEPEPEPELEPEVAPLICKQEPGRGWC